MITYVKEKKGLLIILPLNVVEKKRCGKIMTCNALKSRVVGKKVVLFLHLKLETKTHFFIRTINHIITVLHKTDQIFHGLEIYAIIK